MDAYQAIDDLDEDSATNLDSTAELMAKARSRTQGLDRDRIKKRQRPHFRPKQILPLPGMPQGEVPVAPWQLLHTFARAVSLAGQGSARSFAQHWDCLRYVTALESDDDGRMRLSEEGKNWNSHKRGTQARDLGTAFGLTAATRMLRERHPDHRFDVVDAEIVLSTFRAAKGGRPAAGSSALRPNYFIIGRKPGAPLRLIAVDSRGSHGEIESQYAQLARSQQRVNTVLLGESDSAGEPLPAMMLTTSLLKHDPITTRVLVTEGNGVLAVPGRSALDTSRPVTDLDLPPWIDTKDAGGRPSQRPGFAVPKQEWGRLSRILTRTAAASLLTFAGNREAAGELLTERQRKRLGATGSPVPGLDCDATITLQGVPFVGTDQVFRLNKRRVEVFSALVEDQYLLLKDKRLDEHEANLPELLAAWNRKRKAIAKQWNGVVHMDDSGALLAIRVQDKHNEELS
ncbi:hypothetical protein [Saccharopolyspora gregorii]|uniref:Uncharacterized protein n=1 Tax=Saccharopolyspora gregorii TaxID=33914 RepID=A0ABP6RQT8_9PSEU